MRRTGPRNGGLQRTSRPRWPVSEDPLVRFSIGLAKQEIQLAGRGVPIHPLIPLRLLTGTEPLGNEPVFFWRQAVDGGFNLLNPVHVLSLATPSSSRCAYCR